MLRTTANTPNKCQSGWMGVLVVWGITANLTACTDGDSDEIGSIVAVSDGGGPTADESNSEPGSDVGTSPTGSAEDRTTAEGTATEGTAATEAAGTASHGEDPSAAVSGEGETTTRPVDDDTGNDSTTSPSSINQTEFGNTSSGEGEDSEPASPPSPVATMVEELWSGPKEVSSNSVNPCEAGNCALDTNPCNGDFIVSVPEDLDVLWGCTSISGNLTIGAPQLTTLDGLQSLITIGGDLVIVRNDVLTHLTGLDGLVAIGGSLLIGDPHIGASTGNPALADLAGLEQLRYVAGTIQLANNAALESLSGLGVVAHDGVLLLWNNAALLNLQGLSGLTHVGAFGLRGSPLVTSLDGLENLEQLGALSLESDAALADLDALKGLHWIPGVLKLSGLESLNSLSGLSGLVGVGGIDFYTLGPLASFVGFDSLTLVRGDVGSSFDDFTGLARLKLVGGVLNNYGLSVVGLEDLEAAEHVNLLGDVDLDGFPDGAEFGSLTINYNSVIENLLPLSNVTVSRGLFLTLNANLQTLDGLQHSDDFAYGLALDTNAALTSVEALRGLRSSGDQVYVNDNTALNDLTGLDDLETIGGLLYVSGCAPFPDEGFVGLTNLTTIEGQLAVEPDFDLRLIEQLESAGTLALYSNTTLTDLTPFSFFTVKRGLRLDQDEGLQSLTGLTHDGNLEDRVEVALATHLTNIEGLRGVHAIGTLYLSGATVLTNLEGLDDLAVVGDQLAIRGSTELRNLDALASLTSIGTRLDIISNPSLENLDGLAQLTTIANAPADDSPVVTIINNEVLPQCAADELISRLVDAANGTAYGNDAGGVCL